MISGDRAVAVAEVAPPNTREIGELIENRPSGSSFLVNSRVITDPAVFNRKIQKNFRGTWNLLEFFTSLIGRRTILRTSDKYGSIRALLGIYA